VEGQRWELQLKGAGKTPYSRFADGRAVLRSSLREYLCSEAMAALGVPTTRALSLALTGTVVVRDQFYQGDPRPEPGAVVCRVAPSFLRIGSLELPASRGDLELMRRIAEYAIKHHFPDIADGAASASSGNLSSDAAVSDSDAERYTQLLASTVRSNAELVAHWQTIGFVHGVLNTDNTSLLGLTIDYGPYGFLDAYDPSYTPNTTDLPGRRYCYAKQPMVILWNLLQLAQALAPLTGVPAAERELNKFRDIYDEAVGERWRIKLGLRSWTVEADTESLLTPLLELMAKHKIDFTNLFRSLSSSVHVDGADDASAVAQAAFEQLCERDVLGDDVVSQPETSSSWRAWLSRYASRLMSERDGSSSSSGGGGGEAWHDRERRASMDAANPKYILRNYLAQQAIERAERGDDALLRELEAVLRRPYDEQPEFNHLTARPPAWAQRPGVCVNSCSS